MASIIKRKKNYSVVYSYIDVYKRQMSCSVRKFMVAAARFRFSMVAHRLYPALCWALILF